jgi:hypothetical protein
VALTPTDKASLAAALERAIPSSLDDIVRRNRDRARIGLATEEDLRALEATIGPLPPKDTINGWHMIAIQLSDGDGTVTAVYLLGRTRSTPWITSKLTGLDRAARRVRTHSGSIYELGTPASGEPDAGLLLHICAALWQWGLGPMMGAPGIYY